MLVFQETLVPAIPEKFQKWVIIPSNIVDPARLGMIAELKPGYSLKDFFKGSIPPGQCEKSVGKLAHFLFSLMHCFHNVEFVQLEMRYSVVDFFGNDTDDGSTFRQA